MRNHSLQVSQELHLRACCSPCLWISCADKIVAQLQMQRTNLTALTWEIWISNPGSQYLVSSSAIVLNVQQLAPQGTKSLTVSFTNFHGVITPTMEGFTVPIRWSHWTPSWDNLNHQLPQPLCVYSVAQPATKFLLRKCNVTLVSVRLHRYLLIRVLML